MFWGLIMEPKRRYTQTVQKSFHVSKAALDLYNCDDEPTQLILTYNSRNYLLCTLQKDRILQCSLNLNFNVGDTICFATNGKCNIHLSGYLVEEFDEDDEVSEDEEIPVLIGKKRKGAAALVQQAQKKTKTEQLLDEADDYNSEDDTTFNLDEAEEDDSEAGEEEEDDDEDEEDYNEDEEARENEESSLSDMEEDEPKVVDLKPPVNGIVSKRSEKKKKKEQKQNEQKNVGKSPAPITPNKPKGSLKNDVEHAQAPQKRTLEGGVLVQDLKVGDGQIVKSGKTVQVYYEGRLKHNNKMFDSNKQGPGFKFRVGKQEVIKGWDVGLVGMKVGGKRRISCPPQMAYGMKGSPPVIPPNSTLVFEVEVKNVL